MYPQYIPLPRQAANITGEVFGRLTALGPVGRTHNRTIKWLCRCKCGNTTIVTISMLRCGDSRSCGCLQKEITIRRNTTHGMRNHAMYETWSSIIARCFNPNKEAYALYGKRGITMCPEWRNSFESFYEHISQLPNYGKKGYTLDRIDNNGNYEPGNVRWATQKQQMYNSRKAVNITFRGKTQCIAAWAKELGINKWTLANRIQRLGWSTERALTTPVQKKRKPNPDSYPRR